MKIEIVNRFITSCFTPDDGQSEDRLCAVTGSQDKVQNAIGMIHELLANANVSIII